MSEIKLPKVPLTAIEKPRRTFHRNFNYHHFCRSINDEFEHCFSPVANEYLETVRHTMKKRVVTLSKNTELFRAQRGCNWIPNDENGSEHAIPFDENRMKPWKECIEGRANKKRKPVFYSTTEEATAVKELRAWVGVLISLCSFKTERKLRIVNCVDPVLTSDEHFVLCMKKVFHGKKFHGSTKKTIFKSSELERLEWHNIGNAFAAPVSYDDDPTCYLPTQLIAELMQRAGYDGIAHKSSVGEGMNIILFDHSTVSMTGGRVVEVEKIEVTLKEGPFH